MKIMNKKRIAVFALFSAAGAAMLTGCAVDSSAVSKAPTTIQGATIQGNVHGGQQPIVGATIQLYATGSANGPAGYGSAASPLIASTVTTGAGGSFSITTDYTCPSSSAPVYIVATGGNSGYTTNPNLALMAALGPCGNLTPSTFVSINELTTVASVYTLSPFMTGSAKSYINIGTSSNNAIGLTNAMADVNVLANITTGNIPGSILVAGATLPTQEINTLADIIASCVNSAGGTYNDGSNCGTLFANANPGGTSATAPTDTITALMNIAQHPASSTANLRALFGLQNSQAPFQPTLTVQPNDFTLALTLAGGSLSAPSSLAADASGNIWIANSGANTVTELAHTGAALSGSGYTASLSLPSAIALASDGTVWVTNQGNNTVSRLTPTGESMLARHTLAAVSIYRAPSPSTHWAQPGSPTPATRVSQRSTVQAPPSPTTLRQPQTALSPSPSTHTNPLTTSNGKIWLSKY